MKLRLRLTPGARADLKQIRSYVTSQNPEAARALIVHISDTFEQLRDLPMMGRPRDELEAGLRSLVVGRYLVFYRVTATHVEIARVLHGARDVEAMFG